MTGLLNAQITQSPGGRFYITSQNIRGIAIIKAERDYYRELAIKGSSNLGFAVGIGTSKGVYAEVEYKL